MALDSPRVAGSGAADDRGGDDAAIILRSRHEPEHFAVLFGKYATQIQRYATRRLGAGAADDVVAETFLVAFKQRDRFDLDRRAEIRQYRALARTGIDPVAEPFTDRVDAAASADRSSKPLAAALAGLPAAHRDALLLVAWGDLTYEQAAGALAVPVGTVRSRVHRARGALRRALGGTDPSALHEEPSHE